MIGETSHPDALMAYAIPNAAKRGPALAAIMKAEGMKAGVPDVCIPVPRNGHHGLYIEMKRSDGGAGPTEEQACWIRGLSAHGYRAEVCKGFESARRVVVDYLGIKEAR